MAEKQALSNNPIIHRRNNVKAKDDLQAMGTNKERTAGIKTLK